MAAAPGPIDWSAFSAAEVEMLQAIHLAVCTELDVDLANSGAREAIARAIVSSAANGDRDVSVIQDAARTAGLRALTPG